MSGADWEEKQRRIHRIAMRFSIVLWLLVCVGLFVVFPIWAGSGFSWLMAGVGAVFWICGAAWFWLSRDE